ncbi:alpha/beta hydrolase [Agromyces sp. GXQ0307]|uniref:alpha/beta hydrolase n=1 Tax=Agromyces sp. GXQ0307 TaxID=3377835 RepID=UPI00383B28C7
MTARRRSIAATSVLVASVLLAGCSVPSFLGGGTELSEPTGETVAPELEPFYSQVLEWERCDDKLCTTATAPLDWSDPAAGEIELALVRRPASGQKLGSLLVNPGGPGGSGYEFIADSIDYAAGPRLQERFDVVGFDPRGVGRSSAVACYDAAQMDEFLYGIVPAERGSDEWIADVTAANRDFGTACADETGELLANVDTESAARDLDLLRAILGDERLNYLGFSYGTFLGATYAGLYPEKTGRLVLDGAIDPTASVQEVNIAQYAGFEASLRAYLAACLAGDECPFSGSVDAAADEVSRLLASVDASPLRASDGRRLGADALVTAIIYPLYSPESWPYLSEMFESVMFGEADTALLLADLYNGREPDGTYRDNSTEAFRAVNCLDYTYDDDPAKMRADAAELAEVAPIFGPYAGYGDIGCAQWPVASEADRSAIAAEGAAPIMVIGTTGDPATPYQWAEALAEQLDSGFLVSYDGEGHTAYRKSNECVDRTVEDFLVDGTVPASDPRC